MAFVQPVFGVSGSVHSVGVTTYEGGKTKAGREYQGGSYAEIVLLCDQTVLDGEITDIPATLTVRADASAERKYGKGQLVTFLVTPFVDLVSVKGRWINKIGHRLACEVMPAVKTA
jgi:hypothetical protein